MFRRCFWRGTFSRHQSDIVDVNRYEVKDNDIDVNRYEVRNNDSEIKYNETPAISETLEVSKKKNWFDTCVDFAEGVYYFSQIALGSAIFAGSAMVKGSCWVVQAAPYFPPVPDSWNKFWINKSLDLAKYAVSKGTCFAVNSTPSWFPKVSDGWINNWIDRAGGKVGDLLSGLSSVVSSEYGRFYVYLSPFPSKLEFSKERLEFMKYQKEKNCTVSILKFENPMCVFQKKVVVPLEEKLLESPAFFYRWAGWLLAVAINHYGKDVIYKVKEVSDFGMQRGKGLIQGGFKELRDTRNY